MAKKANRAAAAEAPEETTAQHDNSVEVQQDDNTAAQPADSSIAENTETPARKRRRMPEKLPPIELDPSFVHRPERMQYALLLALLLRQHGTARFSAKDMEHVDTDYNILFARTLDGQHLEVTVVSAESGIIRSPEKQKQEEQWHTKEEEKTSVYQPLTFHPSSDDNPAAVFYRLHGMGMDKTTGAAQVTPGEMTALTPERLAGLQQQKAAQDLAASQQSHQPQVVQFPPSDPRKPTDGSAPYAFPFQVGDRPETSEKLNLATMQAQLMQKDSQIAAEEQAAIERLEQGLS